MKKNIALAIAVALLIDAYRANIRARQGIKKIAEVSQVLAKKLDDNNVSLDEFDHLAIMTITD